jgi:CO dehydrogenase nickel-insertion accessory protein CooC1
VRVERGILTLHFLSERCGVGGMGKGSISDAGSSVLDRSCVRILLCDKDPTNSQQLLELLRKCMYQAMEKETSKKRAFLYQVCFLTAVLCSTVSDNIVCR